MPTRLSKVLTSCISYLWLEKPLLNKQNYVGSYKAKLKNTLCLIAYNKSPNRSEKILTGY